jgi:hypothetical protein
VSQLNEMYKRHLGSLGIPTVALEVTGCTSSSPKMHVVDLVWAKESQHRDIYSLGFAMINWCLTTQPRIYELTLLKFQSLFFTPRHN